MADNAPTTKLSLVQRVIQFIKGGEEAQVEKFFTKVTKTLNSEIRKYERAIASYKADILEIEEKAKDELEDLKVKAESVLLEINPELIKTNADISGYVPTYVDAVLGADSLVADRQKELESDVEAITKKIKKAEAQIQKRKDFIANLK